MSKPHHNDISIGKDAWIEVVDISGRSFEQAVSIEHLITPMESFWSALESNCVADCCGIGAFSLWPDDIKSASLSQDGQILVRDLVALQHFIEQSEADMFVSNRLNNYFDKQVILQVIDHIRHHVVIRPSA
jgi:hypothetical protein